jgi:hypothetical protein
MIVNRLIAIYSTINLLALFAFLIYQNKKNRYSAKDNDAGATLPSKTVKSIYAAKASGAHSLYAEQEENEILLPKHFAKLMSSERSLFWNAGRLSLSDWIVKSFKLSAEDKRQFEDVLFKTLSQSFLKEAALAKLEIDSDGSESLWLRKDDGLVEQINSNFSSLSLDLSVSAKSDLVEIVSNAKQIQELLMERRVYIEKSGGKSYAIVTEGADGTIFHRENMSVGGFNNDLKLRYYGLFDTNQWNELLRKSLSR